MSHWLCSCGDWHPDSRDPDDDHRQVMAVGSEGWDL